MAYLRFNSDKMMLDVSNKIEQKLKIRFEEFKTAVLSKIQWEEARGMAEFEKQFSKTVDEIIVDVRANAYLIIDSFGTGTKSNLEDDLYSKYMQDKEYWNSLRTGKQIVGRKKGLYKDFLTGESIESSGSMAGDPLDYEEISPTSSIQDEWKDLFVIGIPLIIKEVLNSINYNNYFEFR